MSDTPDFMPGAWNAAKTAAFRTAFMEFLKVVRVDTKEFGPVALADMIFDSQRIVLDGVWEGLSNDVHSFAILKSRQLGISTITRALVVFWLGFFKGIRGALIFDTSQHTEEARTELEALIRSIPASAKFPTVQRSNRSMLELSNGSTLQFWSAGTRKGRGSGTLGRGSGINLIWSSEICSWDNDEGVKSLESSVAKEFENRLYIWESTARGMNIWYDMWNTAKQDELRWKTIFAGWWAHPLQKIKKGTAAFKKYAEAPLSDLEKRRLGEVKELYGYLVDEEQLAWFRRQADPVGEGDGDHVEYVDDDLTRQDQPWCVTADTRVGSQRGVVRIVDLVPGDTTTLGTVLAAHKSGEAEIWEVETSLGYKLRGTHHHPLITTDGNEVWMSKSLGVDILLQPPRLAGDIYSVTWREGVLDYSVTVTPEFARLVGLFMGDGSLSGSPRAGYQFSIACDSKDQDVVEECHHLIQSLFGVNSQEYSYREVGDGGWTTVKTTSKLVYDTFKKLNLVTTDTGNTQRRIHVPEFIWRSPKYVVKEFLRGLFEADGFNAYNSPRVVLFSKHHEFVADVQLLLLVFGITSRRRKTQKTNSKGFVYTGSDLTLRATESVMFNEQIGFISARKNNRFTNMKRTENAVRRSKPIVFQDRVITCANTRVIENVYNLTVDGNHWFDANGIVTHNTEDEAFILSGSSFFPSDKINEAMRHAQGERYTGYKFYPGTEFIQCVGAWEKAQTAKDIMLKVWEEPVDDAEYVVAWDPAFGHDEGNDRSALQVLRCYADKVEQVAEFANASTPTHQFAWAILSIVAWYKNCVMIGELNGPGEAVFKEIMDTIKFVKNGYLRAEARGVGVADLFNNVKQFVYSRSDSMTQGAVWQWKCLALSTPLPTPSGWTTMGDVEVGDTLFDENGKPCRVTMATPAMSDHDCYRITFDGKTTIIADADHLWQTSNGDIVPTTALIPGKTAVPINKHLDTPDIDLPIDPYVLGAWLGDGHSANARISAHADDVQEMAQAFRDCGYGVSNPIQEVGRNVWYFSAVGLNTTLKGLGLRSNKHIPPIYLRASYRQRLALLQGLMDTDGTVALRPTNQCAFFSSNQRLAKDFMELLRTLGVKFGYVVRNRTYEYLGKSRPAKESYQITFSSYTDIPVFRLARKRLKHQNANKSLGRPRQTTIRVVKTVERVGSVPVRCIEVDSPSHLYLAGEGMIPTHNTTGQLKVLIFERLRDHLLSNKLELRSVSTLEEMRSITRNGDEIRGEGKAKDDRAFAMALAAHAWTDRIRNKMSSQNRTKAAEVAKTQRSIMDQIYLYNQSSLDTFFKNKQRTRIAAQRAASRQNWKGR